MTTQEQYAAGFTRLKANDIQRAAVEKYLEEYREINRDYAYDIGLPACGRIKNLGARIMELRQAGWDIKTDVRNGVCWYVLMNRPAPVAKSLVL
jgi:hypothetical protein